VDIEKLQDDCEHFALMAEKYRAQAKAAFQLAKEWEEIANERQELLEQMVSLISAKQMLAVAMPTEGKA
jgi:glutamate racemase